MIGLETLEERRRKQDLTQTFKILKGIDQVKPNKIFQSQTDGHQRVTRNTDPLNLLVPAARTDLRMYSFQLRAAKAWNSLDKKTKEVTSLAAFKNAINKLGETVGD